MMLGQHLLRVRGVYGDLVLAIQLWAVVLNLVVSTQYLWGWRHCFGGGRFGSRGGLYDLLLGPKVFQRLWEWRGPFEIDFCEGPSVVELNPALGQELGLVSPYLMEAMYTDVLTFMSPKRYILFLRHA
jgi:hypothetical protein